jgi:hypothetical protein
MGQIFRQEAGHLSVLLCLLHHAAESLRGRARTVKKHVQNCFQFNKLYILNLEKRRHRPLLWRPALMRFTASLNRGAALTSCFAVLSFNA